MSDATESSSNVGIWILAFVILCCVVLCIVYFGNFACVASNYKFGYSCPADPAIAIAAAAAAATPAGMLSALIALGTPIQVNAIDPLTLSGPFSASQTPPDCTSLTNAVYSFTMDIQPATTWTNVAGSTYQVFKHSIPSGTDAPAFYINNGGGAGKTWWESLGVSIQQETVGASAKSGNMNQQVYNNLLVPGSYKTITVVSNGTSINLYVNGVLNTDISSASDRVNTTGIKWTPSATWSWSAMHEPLVVPPAGTMLLKNFYWFANKALTIADMAVLSGTPPASSSGTSTYAMEPSPFEQD